MDGPPLGPTSASDQQGAARGNVLTAVSDGIVALLKDFYGKGPTRAKTYYQDDLVVCLLRGGFTRVEETLREAGRGDEVIQQRMAFQEVMRDRFQAVIERATGRRVIGFMSGNQQQPDMLCEVFVLAPTDLLDEAAMEATGIERVPSQEIGASSDDSAERPAGEITPGPGRARALARVRRAVRRA
jgi:uncharacterized protein YbcI